MAVDVNEEECEKLQGLKRRLCEGYKIDQGVEVEMDDYEHKRWLASFRGEPVPPRRKSRITTIRNPSPPPEGVGTELENLFGTIKFASCGDCKRLRDDMNKWGSEGCRERKDEILKRLAANAKKRKVLRKVFSKTAASLFVDQAIGNWDLRQAGIAPPTGIFSNVISSVSKLLKLENRTAPKKMVWSYGITTVPERLNTLFPKTLKSLASAGFDKPHLFVDKCDSPEQYAKFNLPYTCHSSNIGTVGNWITAMWELYVSNPHAHRYAIFQDDFVTYLNLRDYLDKVDYPERGYLNLYTFPENEKHLQGKPVGFHPSNQKGKGAVALVFNLEAVKQLLQHRYMVKRPGDPGGRVKVDGAIVDTYKKIGWKEYVHTPSLIQHTGLVSSMGHHNQPLAPSFRGEKFDARKLLQTPNVSVKPVDASTVGLVGFHCNTGLGELNRQIATYCSPEGWLIKPHGVKKTNELLNIDTQTLICKHGDARVSDFVQQHGTLLFCETAYYPGLIDEAKKANRRIVCVPMLEWTPKQSWTKKIDLFICPTLQCYLKLKMEGLPCVHFPWPIDVPKFEFQPRTLCKKFLFLNGNGGWRGRKGLDVLLQAKELWPALPVMVRTQKPIKTKLDLEILGEVPNNSDLYLEGDVLVSPHTVDGLGLELMEAMACGMPVISTSGQPWDEIPSVSKIESVKSKKAMGRQVDWYTCSPESLVRACKRMLGVDITQSSHDVRKWAESRSWESQKQQFMDMVISGVPK